MKKVSEGIGNLDSKLASKKPIRIIDGFTEKAQEKQSLIKKLYSFVAF